MTKKRQRFNALSPDGFAISRDKTYSSKEKAEQALDEWIERYRTQGYYSMSDRTRLPLDEIKNYCEIIPIN